MYKCEIEGCDWSGSVRSTIRNRESKYHNKRVCPYHRSQYGKKKDKKPEFYKKHVQSIIDNGVRCMETGKPLLGTSMEVLHIFDKSNHPSISDNDLNVIYAHGWDVHTRFDDLLLRGDFDRLEKEFPKIWLEIFKRLPELLNLCEEKETKLYNNLEEYYVKNQ